MFSQLSCADLILLSKWINWREYARTYPVRNRLPPKHIHAESVQTLFMRGDYRTITDGIPFLWDANMFREQFHVTVPNGADVDECIRKYILEHRLQPREYERLVREKPQPAEEIPQPAEEIPQPAVNVYDFFFPTTEVDPTPILRRIRSHYPKSDNAEKKTLTDEMLDILREIYGNVSEIIPETFAEDGHGVEVLSDTVDENMVSSCEATSSS